MKTEKLLEDPTRRAQISEYLRRSILRGDLKPGSRLNEAHLADKLGVSRGPLREAVRELTGRGLLTSEPYMGSSVVVLSAREIEEVYSARTCLENYAFRISWERRHEGLLDEMVRCLGELNETLEIDDIVVQIDAELAFHDVAYKFSKSEVLISLWNLIRDRLQICMMLYRQERADIEYYKKCHDGYIAVVRDGSFVQMEAEILEHMSKGCETVLKRVVGR